MLPAITTTHVKPHRHLSGCACAGQEEELAMCYCCYCLEPLGVARDAQSRARLQKSHKCGAKRLMKKPSASVPYN